MKFGDKLICSQHPPWTENYIDYIRLKRLLQTHFESSSEEEEEEEDDSGRHYFGEEDGETAVATAGRKQNDSDDRQPLLPPPPPPPDGNINNVNNIGWVKDDVYDAPRSSNPSSLHPLHYGSTSSTTMSNNIINNTKDTNNNDGNNHSVHHNTTTTSTTTTTSVSSIHSFEIELKYEIQKSLLFLLKTLGELSTDLSDLLKRHRALSLAVVMAARNVVSTTTSSRADGGDDGDDTQHRRRLLLLQQQEKTHLLQDIENLRLDFIVRIGSTLLLLLEFVELNIEAIVKIVKKHDKVLSEWEKKKTKKKEGGGGGDNKKTWKKYCTTRLRRQYLPRFAVYSSDPNVRCLFLAAADAGDCSGSSKAGISSSSKSLQLSTAMRKESGNFGGWDVMQWNLEVALRELFEWEQELRGMGGGNGIARQLERPMPRRPSPATARSYSVFTLNESKVDDIARHRSRPSAVENFLTRSTTLLNVNSNVLSSLKSGSSAVLSSLKFSPSNANLAVDNSSTFFEPMIYRIQSHRHRIGQMHDRYTRMVYAHEMLYLVGDRKQIQREEDNYLLRGQEDFGSVEKLENIRRQSIGGDLDGKKWMEEGYLTKTSTVSKFSKLLNLASASLYMCNYNIVAPTSGLYAKMLGFDPACAGIIIGMTPMAVIVSCVLYSWWSSYSYKRAIIFASFSCIVGNLVYALALPFKSMKMVLIGRLLTGFGSARVINRRYIADYYSIEDRTSGMVDLVTASALGSAVGPAIAASLSLIAPAHLSGTNTYWTIETAPGYVMFFLWSVLCICYVMFFEEPERANPIETKPPSISKEIQLVNGGPLPNESNAEKKPLLSLEASNSKDVKCFESETVLRSCGNVPVLISLMLIVLLKAVLEGLSSSAPTVSRYYFGWGVHANGIFLAVLASCVLPTNIFVAHISRRFDDRELITATLVVMLVGILGVLNYGEGSRYSEARFVLFGLIIFVSCNALEGPTMGLLSKTIPKSLANGILNAGLLSTEAGTVGRVLGDVWFSSSTFMGLDRMLNRTFGPMSMMILLSIGAVLQSYTNLQPTFEVDSEDDSEDGDGDDDDDE